jgi:hypothetical protein
MKRFAGVTLVAGFACLIAGGVRVLVAHWRAQDRLQQTLVDDEWFKPPIAGLFRDRRPQAHPWLWVIGAARHPETGERYLLLQDGGSGASYFKESEIDLFADEPAR